MKYFTPLLASVLFAPLVAAEAHVDLICQAGGRTAGYIKVENKDSRTARIKMGYLPEAVFLVTDTDDGTKFIMEGNNNIQIDLDDKGWARLFDYEEKSGNVGPDAVYKCE